MILLDVNVLVYAHRKDAVGHEQYLAWLMDVLTAPAPFAVSELVLSGFIRITTHPRVFDPPSALAVAIAYANLIREQPNCVVLSPGPRHWDLFTRLCLETECTGNLVPDAYHAALAIEHGAQWITTDKGFDRFRELDWRHPLH